MEMENEAMMKRSSLRKKMRQNLVVDSGSEGKLAQRELVM